ncbi:MAG: hypothetical protein MUO76_14695 [Anaerolineaceae bacterium]|nr:hypothetical protein [Anaerolineaceae bacterium]
MANPEEEKKSLKDELPEEVTDPEVQVEQDPALEAKSPTNEIEKPDDSKKCTEGALPADAGSDEPPDVPESIPDVEVSAIEAVDVSDEAVEDLPPKPSLLYKLFSPETKFGRFMRRFLRIAGVIVGLFALGVLTVYILMYAPMKAEKERLQSELGSELAGLQEQLSDTELELDMTKAELSALETTSQDTIDELETALEQASFRNDFLMVKNDAIRARIALLDEESGPGGPVAMTALNETRQDLQVLLPALEERDPIIAGLLDNRLSVVIGELVRDSQQAKIELEKFYTTLLEVESDLFD